MTGEVQCDYVTSAGGVGILCRNTGSANANRIKGSGRCVVLREAPQEVVPLNQSLVLFGLKTPVV